MTHILWLLFIMVKAQNLRSLGLLALASTAKKQRASNTFSVSFHII